MRLCRFQHNGETRLGFMQESQILDFHRLANSVIAEVVDFQPLLNANDILDVLPTDGAPWQQLVFLWNHVAAMDESDLASCMVDRDLVTLLPPVGRPPKLLLLAGNYTDHILEQNDLAREKHETFPYVFSKPPSTCLVGSGAQFKLPEKSRHSMDHEVELAVVIGKPAFQVNASDALSCVAGYTVINDLSDRGFRPNPDRLDRPRDKFFDWLHGKWHQGSCPCGPCIVDTAEIPDPQNLEMELHIDGEIRQHGSTRQQIYTVAETIAFISSWVALEPGDIISTGTPSGVGNASGRFLQPGQTVTARIAGIGTLVTQINA